MCDHLMPNFSSFVSGKIRYGWWKYRDHLPEVIGLSPPFCSQFCLELADPDGTGDIVGTDIVLHIEMCAQIVHQLLRAQWCCDF